MNSNDSQFIHELKGSKAEMGRGAVLLRAFSSASLLCHNFPPPAGPPSPSLSFTSLFLSHTHNHTQIDKHANNVSLSHAHTQVASSSPYNLFGSPNYATTQTPLQQIFFTSCHRVSTLLLSRFPSSSASLTSCPSLSSLHLFSL